MYIYIYSIWIHDANSFYKLRIHHALGDLIEFPHVSTAYQRSQALDVSSLDAVPSLPAAGRCYVDGEHHQVFGVSIVMGIPQ